VKIHVRTISSVAADERSLDPATQAFPSLTPAQIDRLRPYAKIRPVAAGEILFDVGDSAVSMFVVLTGKLEIVQPTSRANGSWYPTMPGSSPARRI
jgi:CRP-like cAMP-binding protein